MAVVTGRVLGLLIMLYECLYDYIPFSGYHAKSLIILSICFRLRALPSEIMLEA